MHQNVIWINPNIYQESRPWLVLDRLHLAFTQPIAGYGFRSKPARRRQSPAPESAIPDKY
jgi:hypothetical protein